jgi:hypothetical protein
MKCYVIYEAATGAPRRNVRAPEAMIAAQVGPGESYIESDDFLSLAGKLVREGGLVDDPAADEAAYAMAISERRRDRDALLNATDFALLPFSPYSPAEQETIAAYRAALRRMFDTLHGSTVPAFPPVELYGVPSSFASRVASRTPE